MVIGSALLASPAAQFALIITTGSCHRLRSGLPFSAREPDMIECPEAETRL